MRNRRDVIAIGLLLFLLLALALITRPGADRTSSRDQRVTTFRTGPYGAAALYALLEELDIPARRQLRSWTADTSAGAVVLLAPVQFITPREADVLRDWVTNGGTLVYAPGGFPDAVGADFGVMVRSLRPDTLGALATVRWRGVTAYPEPHVLTAAIDSIAEFTHAFRLNERMLRGDSVTVLMRTAEGAPVVIVMRVGAGRVMAWSDAGILANARLRNGGAPLLFARVAGDAVARGGTVRFDEFHQGYREASAIRALARLATETGAGRALLQAFVACLVLLLLAGSRFGAPLIEHNERRRSPLEHVEALSSAYQRAGAHRTARRLIVAGMERRLGRRVLTENGMLPPAALDVSGAGRRLKVEWERGAEADLVSLAAAADDFVMEIKRWK